MLEMSLLVVDDDPGIRGLLRRILEREGMAVLEARNGREAIRAIDEQRPELAIVDIFMPDMDGFETLGALRRQFPGVGLVVMSGAVAEKGGPDYLGMANRLGADAILPKPFDRKSVMNVVALARVAAETRSGGRSP